MSKIYGAWKGYRDAKKLGDEERNSSVDALVKRAALDEAGYETSDSMFGGQPLKRTEQFGAVPEGYTRFGGKVIQDRSPAYLAQVADSRTALNQDPKKQELMDLSIAEKQRKAESDAMVSNAKEDAAQTQAQEMVDTIETVKKTPKYFGPAGDTPTLLAPSSIPKSVGGQGEYGQRAEWEANVNKLLAGKVIAVMNAMKSASRTGATGFGQLNRSELQLLKDASTQLNRRLPPEVAMKYLNALEVPFQKVLGASKKFGQPTSAQQQEPVQNEDDPMGILS